MADRIHVEVGTTNRPAYRDNPRAFIRSGESVYRCRRAKVGHFILESCRTEQTRNTIRGVLCLGGPIFLLVGVLENSNMTLEPELA